MSRHYDFAVGENSVKTNHSEECILAARRIIKLSSIGVWTEYKPKKLTILVSTISQSSVELDASVSLMRRGIFLRVIPDNESIV